MLEEWEQECPLTKAVNKQLLPLYDKLSYILSSISFNVSRHKDILIIVNKGQLNQFRKVLPEKNNLGIKIKYVEQKTKRSARSIYNR